MRLIATGCEYSGVSTLVDGLVDWGRKRGLNFHLDDHFSIPDRYHLDPEGQQAMVDLLPVSSKSASSACRWSTTSACCTATTTSCWAAFTSKKKSTARSTTTPAFSDRPVVHAGT